MSIEWKAVNFHGSSTILIRSSLPALDSIHNQNPVILIVWYDIGVRWYVHHPGVQYNVPHPVIDQRVQWIDNYYYHMMAIWLNTFNRDSIRGLFSQIRFITFRFHDLLSTKMISLIFIINSESSYRIKLDFVYTDKLSITKYTFYLEVSFQKLTLHIICIYH